MEIPFLFWIHFVAFFIRKRIAVEIELIHVCTRGRKTCIFYPFSSSSSEIDPFRTVVFLFADAKLYENKHACDAGGMGFHGLNGRSPHSFSWMYGLDIGAKIDWTRHSLFPYSKNVYAHILTFLSFGYATNALKSNIAYLRIAFQKTKIVDCLSLFVNPH